MTMLGCNSKADVYLTIISLSRHDDHRCRSKCWAGGLEIRLAGAHTITPATGQTATSTIARIEFQMIGACGNRSDDDGEATIAVNVGCNDPKFHRRDGFGHTLPRNCGAGTTSAAGKLAESLGKRGAEDVNTDLIELAGRRAHQFKGHRQLACRRRHGPRDVAISE